MSKLDQDIFLRDQFVDEVSNCNRLVLTGPNDTGVRLNKGRAGARFAPKTVLNTFKRLNSHNGIKYCHKETCADNQVDLNNLQKSIYSKNSDHLKELQPGSKVIHIGGGHDHVYPLLKSLQEVFNSKIVILNIDAHMDTRVHTIKNSGTPFRNFDDELNVEATLIQYGIQNITNSKSTLSPLKNIKQSIRHMEEIFKATDHLSKIDLSLISEIEKLLDKDTVFLISLDCDAIAGDSFKGVSAVNPYGFAPDYILELIKRLNTLPSKTTCLGIYEYNPVYDDLSNFGARYLAKMISDF